MDIRLTLFYDDVYDTLTKTKAPGKQLQHAMHILSFTSYQSVGPIYEQPLHEYVFYTKESCVRVNIPMDVVDFLITFGRCNRYRSVPLHGTSRNQSFWFSFVL